MDSTISSFASLSTPKFRCFDPTNACSATTASHRRSFSNLSPSFKASSRVNMVSSENSERKIVAGDGGYVLEDVPHLSDYIPDLPIVVQKDSPRGTHFRRAGPRQRVYFESDEVYACIVTCGGLCPGVNTVIREIVCGLHHMYGVNQVLGIEGGYRGFYARNTIPLTPKVVNDIHKRGGTILGTSRGGHDTSKIVDSIQDRGINQVYIIGGDGTQKGASVIFEEIRRRGLKVAVAGIPKTIDNDIPVIDKSFGFDTAVEEAQRAINAAHVEAESFENCIGVVKLMGRYSGFIAMYATLASRDVDCCLIPESPFYLEGPGGLFEFIEKRLKENGHMVIVIAEGAGQDLLTECMRTMDQQDASGNKLLQDVGLWISQKIKKLFSLEEVSETPFLRSCDKLYALNSCFGNGTTEAHILLPNHSSSRQLMLVVTGELPQGIGNEFHWIKLVDCDYWTEEKGTGERMMAWYRSILISQQFLSK
ncbi:hypothetical protein JRO89_XS09G0191000 [Xanthoceras sorbifolium]|uniref:Phosphofructokinase domain-containing protein n=1 Tax=Xanthoceras sorbifolium TaxID=99658 RepID=A0ABQ8HLW3_9ROSI|nr:hypothetical protein JRO89_XS09G0191000 [Xanthoceras sorbifolium]